MSNKIRNEFKEFLSGSESPSKDFDARFLQTMRDRIQPDIARVWPKFVFAQLAAALITLTVCPQFGVGPLGGGHGLGHVFMSFGEAVCAAFCGAFFLATGTAVATLILKKGERREVFNYRFRIMGAVSVASFLTLMGIGTSLELPMLYNEPFEYGMWLLGAFVASLLTLQLGKFSLSFSKHQ